ncbi:hypothetical protein Tco_1302761, partial [Tanacetum coccineum]
TFSKIYIVKVVGSFLSRVLEFRNNGEVVIQLDEYRIKVYEPLSGIVSGAGINGNQGTLSARSYMETLLLLDQSDSIIH